MAFSEWATVRSTNPACRAFSASVKDSKTRFNVDREELLVQIFRPF